MVEREQPRHTAGYTPWPPGPSPTPPRPTGIPEIDRLWDPEYLRYLVNLYRSSPVYELEKSLPFDRAIPISPPCEWVKICMNKMTASIGVSTSGALMWRDNW